MSLFCGKVLLSFTNDAVTMDRVRFLSLLQYSTVVLIASDNRLLYTNLSHVSTAVTHVIYIRYNKELTGGSMHGNRRNQSHRRRKMFFIMGAEQVGATVCGQIKCIDQILWGQLPPLPPRFVYTPMNRDPPLQYTYIRCDNTLGKFGSNNLYLHIIHAWYVAIIAPKLTYELAW